MSGISLRVATIALALLGVSTPAFAEQSAVPAALSAEDRALLTYTRMLVTLAQRRVELAQSSVESKAEALAFLDGQIATLGRRIAESRSGPAR